MKHKTLVLILLIMSILIGELYGCSVNNTPPDISIVEASYLSNADDIDIIVDFLLSTNYADIYITDNSGIMLADLNRVPITSPNVIDAIDRILSSRAYQHINKNGNTISLLQWSGIRDIGCGIAYSINGVEMPEIEFLTELTPLSHDSWYYYVSDYNAWRKK